MLSGFVLTSSSTKAATWLGVQARGSAGRFCFLAWFKAAWDEGHGAGEREQLPMHNESAGTSRALVVDFPLACLRFGMPSGSRYGCFQLCRCRLCRH